MYQFAVILFLIIPALYACRILFKKRIRFHNVSDLYISGLRKELAALKNVRQNNFFEHLFHLKHLLYHFTIILALIMILTGFIPAAFFGMHLSGIFLLIHVLTAPFFCVAIALLILLYANQHTFTEEDKNKGSLILYSKISFWVFAFFSIPAILSIAFSLFPLFGSEGLENLFLLHQISVLFLSLSLLVHSCCLIISTVKIHSSEIL